jgi:hypothetical protein
VEKALVINVPPGAGKSTLFLSCLHHAAGNVSPQFTDVLQRNIATVDRLRSDLTSGSAQVTWPVYAGSDGPWLPGPLPGGSYSFSHPGATDPASASWYAGGAVATTTPADSGVSSVRGVVAPTISLTAVSLLANPGNYSWLPAAAPSFQAASPVSSDQVLFRADAPDTVQGPSADHGTWDKANVEFIEERELPWLDLIRLGFFDTNAASACVTAGPLSDVRLIVRLDLAPDLRDQLLRLVDGIRSTLRLMLLRVLSALSRRPNALGFGLVLLATARCFGHRGEPDDHILSALVPMSIVNGEAAGSV